ncbi:MAG: hypothetical protein EAZ06_06675 [Cytophagales bacterium]|nr:MAG: hypothetical protein EAZ06_06675 [Cytophagales bacterium]
MKCIFYLFFSLSFFVTSCQSHFNLRQEVAGLDGIQFIFYHQNKENDTIIKVTLKDKHYRRNFVNSLSIKNQENIDLKTFDKIGKVIFQRKNMNVVLLEGKIFKNKKQYYFYCQFQQKKYIKKINQNGIDLLDFAQQFPESVNALPQ